MGFSLTPHSLRDMDQPVSPSSFLISMAKLLLTGVTSANPNVWRMMFDIFRFNYFALDLFHMDPKEAGKLTVGEYLDHEGYSTNFAECYLLVSRDYWAAMPRGSTHLDSSRWPHRSSQSQ